MIMAFFFHLIHKIYAINVEYLGFLDKGYKQLPITQMLLHLCQQL